MFRHKSTLLSYLLCRILTGFVFLCYKDWLPLLSQERKVSSEHLAQL